MMAATPGQLGQRAADRATLFDDDFVRSLERLHMLARKVVSGGQRANRRSKKLGSGIEFADHRTYSRGDDFRYIDWNLYGRLDRLLLRLFEEEEDLYIYLCIDVSDSMCLGTPPKVHHALRVAAALAYIGLANLDRVAIVPFHQALAGRLPSTRGKQRIFSILDFLRSCPLGGHTDIAAAMSGLTASKARRGLVVLISDFYDPVGFERGLNLLRYAKHEPFVLQLIDPAEAAPRLHGELTLVDCETGEPREVTVSPALLAAYTKAHAVHRERLRAYCAGRGIPYFPTDTTVPFDQLLQQIFQRGGFLR